MSRRVATLPFRIRINMGTIIRRRRTMAGFIPRYANEPQASIAFAALEDSVFHVDRCNDFVCGDGVAFAGSVRSDRLVDTGRRGPRELPGLRFAVAHALGPT